jgi:hypothetical protein
MQPFLFFLRTSVRCLKNKKKSKIGTPKTGKIKNEANKLDEVYVGGSGNGQRLRKAQYRRKRASGK